MERRCCVFVDGENLRHAIVDLFQGEFDRSEYLPKSADWGALFDWMVAKTAPQHERLRTYWYVIENIDFFPYRFPQQLPALRTLLGKYKPFDDELKLLTGNALELRMQAMVKELRERQMRMKNRFDGWVTLQDGISLRHNAIEFRRAGAIRYNLFDGSLGPEKAVDVKLATDLVVLRDIYDLAVIVSGDQDYVPAVKWVKDTGRRVVNVAFLTRGGKLLPGGARRLNQVADWSLEVPYAELKAHLNIKTPTPAPKPPPLQAPAAQPATVATAPQPVQAASGSGVLTVTADLAAEVKKAGAFLPHVSRWYFENKWRGATLAPPGSLERRAQIEEAIKKQAIEVYTYQDTKGRDTEGLRAK